MVGDVGTGFVTIPLVFEESPIRVSIVDVNDLGHQDGEGVGQSQ
jgi:hypothetical protein